MLQHMKYNDEEINQHFKLNIIRKNKKGRIDMLIEFNEMAGRTITGMNGGDGEITAKMFADQQGKIIFCCIHPGGSIGLHIHKTSDDINYVISGTGLATCDGNDEVLTAGSCHICKKGSQHSIMNTGSEDLVLLTVVTER